MSILVIDVGTSSIRGVLYNSDGCSIFWHQINYHVKYFANGYAEQNPCDWSDSIVEICRKTVDFCTTKNLNIDAISLTSQRSSIIPMDKYNKPLYNAIMWQDKRNADIVNSLSSEQDRVNSLTGARINTVFSGTKMTWFKHNEPELYSKTKKICTIADFIVNRITGEYKTDHTYGSRSLLMNIRTRNWDDSLLDLFDVDKEKLCELVSPSSIIGYVCDDFAEKTGLKTGIPMISAGGDQQCAALGQGVTMSGSVEITTGTGAFMLGYSDSVPENLSNNVICGAHSIPDKYVLESSMLACAAMYNWINKTLFSQENDFSDINNAINNSPAGANGCIVLPYFQGRGTPDWNNNATGCFLNLNLATSKNDMARALLESIAYEACINLNILENYMGNIDRIYIGGGLTKFTTFNQIQADVYQKNLILNNNFSEQTSLGAWSSAAVTLGLFKDHEEAMSYYYNNSNFTNYIPNKNLKKIYTENISSMKSLYNKLFN